MKYNEQPAFDLTPTEERILALLRAGKNKQQIYNAMGWHGRSPGAHSMAFTNILEKERLRILAERDKTRPGGTTRLVEAHGSAGRQSDPRRGKWKRTV